MFELCLLKELDATLGRQNRPGDANWVASFAELINLPNGFRKPQPRSNGGKYLQLLRR
jgi:hypothetical protein